MKTILLSVLLIGCAVPKPKYNNSKPRPVKSYHELRQDRILECTMKFIQRGVEFDSAVKGCKEDIYYK
jgi:hypothetical protein